MWQSVDNLYTPRPITVWVSRKLDSGEIVVWGTESAAKAAFASGAYGMPWKKQVNQDFTQ